MRQSGIFSFVLFVLLIEVVFFLQTMSLNASTEMNETIMMLEEAEHLNFRRQEIEMNFDYIISRTIQAGNLGGFDSDEIRHKISENLVEFFSETEAQSKGKIKFLFYERPSGESGISHERIAENFVVLIIDGGKGIIIVQVFVTGNIGKNEKLGAEISGIKAKQKFIVPIGYTHSEMVVGKSLQ